MTKFEATTEYAGKRVVVKSDSFAELHQTLAGIEELNRDEAYLRGLGIEDVVPTYRRDGNENEYFGLQDRSSRRNVTFGAKREKGIIPFFPKGEEGYYGPEDASRGRQPSGRESSNGRQQPPQQQPPQPSSDQTSAQQPTDLSPITKDTKAYIWDEAMDRGWGDRDQVLRQLQDAAGRRYGSSLSSLYETEGQQLLTALCEGALDEPPKSDAIRQQEDDLPF